MGIDLRKEYAYSLIVPTSMGVRLTPVGGQPMHLSDTFVMQATSAESNVASISAVSGAAGEGADHVREGQSDRPPY